MLGGTEMILVVVVIVLLFGSSQLPKLARSIGQAQKEFKKGIDEGATDVENESNTNSRSDTA